MRKHTKSLALVAAAALSGCTLGPDFFRPDAPPISQYTATPLPEQTASAEIAGGDAQKFLANADVPGRWWTQFGSPELDSLIDEALRNNANVAAAQATLAQYEQFYRAARGLLFPQVNGSGLADREGAFNGTPFNVFNAAINISYTLDIFGAVRRNIEAAGAVSEYQRFQLESTYLTLISSVLTTAIATASLSAQIAAINDIIAAQSMQLDLLNQQFELGAVARGDVLAQQSQLAVTQASLPPLIKQLSFARNSLAVLLGGTPSGRPIPAIDLVMLKLPQELPVSVPSKLVEQRPDIRASEALLHQASAQVGVATAALFPSFNLSGSVVSATNGVPGAPTFLSADSFAWTVAGQVAAPIFRGGTLVAQRQAAIFNYDRANALYRGTILTAFADVANVLTALQLDAELLRAQLYAEESARQSLDITQERFRAGAIAYLALLDAQRVYQQARIALVTAQANRYADTVALFQALGGGWWNRQDPGIQQVSNVSTNGPP